MLELNANAKRAYKLTEAILAQPASESIDIEAYHAQHEANANAARRMTMQ